MGGNFDDFAEETGEWKASSRVSEGNIVLLVLAPGGIRSFELARGGLSTIGRAPTSELFVDHPSVSRAHAQISVDPEGGVRLRDLGSRNGTRVNGQATGDATILLHVGDQIAFGDVNAQLQMVRRLPTARLAQWLQPDDFDRALVVEAERALRFALSLGFVRIDVVVPPNRADDLRALITRALRLIDVVTPRAPGRFDLMMPGCDKESAIGLAKRIHELLRALGTSARLGVAAYPGDAPSPESLPLAAQLALHGVDDGVGAAHEAARVLHIGKHEVVVAEPEMVRLFALIERAAESPMPVLVHGETGSGKEIVAEALHALGSRAGKPLVRLNCAAVTETLLESELFGHERGAFSGAVAAKPGLIEQADGGTLFLDEIAEMSPALQAKLLRVLEDHTVRRVGGLKDKQVHIRLVAASHRDLGDQVARGLFRQDLFYRLNSLVLRVPPLRQRRHEILLMADRFIAQSAKEIRRPQLTLSPAASAALGAYDWPGNIRELRNVIRRAVMMAEGDTIGVEHLPPEVAAAQPSSSAAAAATSSSANGHGHHSGTALTEPMRDEHTAQIVVTPSVGIKTAVEQLERGMIVNALREHQGNQTRAAAQLGITRQALAQKLTKYGIGTDG